MLQAMHKLGRPNPDGPAPPKMEDELARTSLDKASKEVTLAMPVLMQAGMAMEGAISCRVTFHRDT
jgi:hypothetical protein